MPRTGTLACLDPRMNIALENTEELIDGVPRRNYGDSCIRGNNGETGTPKVWHRSVLAVLYIAATTNLKRDTPQEPTTNKRIKAAAD